MIKGFCCNDESNDAVNDFSPDFIVIGWGSWLLNPLLNYGNTQFVILFEDADPNLPKTIANILAVHNLRTTIDDAVAPLWCLLREPDLAYPNVQDAINKANADKALILSAVPSAKFILQTGTGINPPYKENSYGRQLLAGMTTPKKIKYLGFTFYPEIGAPSFSKYVNKMVEWGAEEEKGLACMEYGIIKNETPTNIDVGLTFTYTNATNYMIGKIDYASWYAQKDIPGTRSAGYKCLLDSNGDLTPTGQEF